MDAFTMDTGMLSYVGQRGSTTVKMVRLDDVLNEINNIMKENTPLQLLYFNNLRIHLENLKRD